MRGNGWQGAFYRRNAKGHQQFIKVRAVYYAATHIHLNAPKGKIKGKDWDFEQKIPLYIISLLDFPMPSDDTTQICEHADHNYKQVIQLCNRDTGQVLYNKLTFIFVNIPKL